MLSLPLLLAALSGGPDKLLEITSGEGHEVERLAGFLGIEEAAPDARRVNESPGWIYGGESLALAHVHRVLYQTFRASGSFGVRAMAALRVRVLRRPK